MNWGHKLPLALFCNETIICKNMPKFLGEFCFFFFNLYFFFFFIHFFQE